jgi:hypothetical protein
MQMRVLQVLESVEDRAFVSQPSNTLRPFVGSNVRFPTRHSPASQPQLKKCRIKLVPD